MDELLTTTEAAALLGVGASTIKRWSDEGRIPSMMTVGKHRRFQRQDIERFLTTPAAALTGGRSDFIDRSLRALLPRPNLEAMRAILYLSRSQADSWAETCDRLAALFNEIGNRWVQGQLSIYQERLCTAVVSGLVEEVATGASLPSRAPTAVLATVYGDHHLLGLKMAHLVLRENGWRSFWMGDLIPAEELALAVQENRFDAIVLSATQGITKPGTMEATLAALEPATLQSGATLILGGSADWPRSRAGVEVASFRVLDRWAAAFRTASRE